MTEEIKEEPAVVEKEFVSYVIAMDQINGLKETVDFLFGRDLEKWRQLHILENSCKNFEKRLTKIDSQLAGYGKLQELNQLRTDSVEQETDDLEEKATKQLDDLKETTDFLISRDLEKYRQFELFDHRIENIEKESDKTEKRFGGVSRLLDMVQEECGSLQQRVDDLFDKVKEHEAAVARLRASLASLKNT